MINNQMQDCNIGTSGWSYNHWQGILYPPGLPAINRLEVYAQRFNTVELNSSFYHWPRAASFQNWHDRLPERFRLSVKAPRGLTHGQRLSEPETWLERIQRGMDILGEKRGMLLVQLPPDMARDDARLEGFLKQLPPQLRVAFEFRHPSWHVEPVFALLERHGAAYCVMSGAGLPCLLQATAPFVYVRLHGPSPPHLYAGSYTEDDLDWWATRLNEWRAAGHTCWAYFNNDAAGNAVRNARRLQELVKGQDF
jgi:uncharacterized protein YecE (DUF72 family)